MSLSVQPISQAAPVAQTAQTKSPATTAKAQSAYGSTPAANVTISPQAKTASHDADHDGDCK